MKLKQFFNYALLIISIYILSSLRSYGQEQEADEASVEKKIDMSPAIIADVAPSTSEAGLKTEEMEVVVGIDKTLDLDFDFSSQIIPSDNTVIRVESDIKKRKIVLTGLKTGTSSLTIKNSVGEDRVRYFVNVTSNELSKTVLELRELIGDVEGIEIGIKGGRVYVGGEIVVPNDIKKIAAVLSSFPSGSNILKLIEMSPQTQVLIASEMHEELQKNNFKNVTVRVVNKSFWVEGTVGSQDEAALVQKITTAYLPEKIEAVSAENITSAYPEGRQALSFFLSIDSKSQQEEKKEPIPKLVKVNTQFVELRKDYNKVFGFKWAPLMSRDGSKITIGPNETSAGTTTKSDGLFTAVISDLFPRLNSMKNAGYGRVVHSGMVIVSENKKGDLSRSTQVPTIVGQNSDFSRAASIEFGLTMGVTPKVLEDDNVEMDIEVKVSLETSSTNGVPIPTSNRVATNIIVKSAETAVLGGVMQSHDLANYDRDDPAPNTAAVSQNSTEAPPQQLFGILRSRNQSIARNQYVVFITPEIVASASEATESIKNKFKKRGR